MGRTYAGILGSLAFSVAVARGLIDGGGIEPTMKAALGSMLAFAAIGYIAGRVAASVVDDSVQARFHAELSAEKAAQKQKQEQKQKEDASTEATSQ